MGATKISVIFLKLKCEKLARAKHQIMAYKVAPNMKALIIKEF
jgi:hypothetical protein